MQKRNQGVNNYAESCTHQNPDSLIAMLKTFAVSVLQRYFHQ